MAMQLTTQWVCDRCKVEVFEVLATIPDGWKAYAELDLYVDAENLMADVKLPSKNKVWYHCGACVRDFRAVHMDFPEAEEPSTDTVESTDGRPTLEETLKKDIEDLALPVVPLEDRIEGDG